MAGARHAGGQKVTALLKSLHQKPRARLTPLPDFVAEFIELQPFCQGGLVDTLLQGREGPQPDRRATQRLQAGATTRRTCS